MTGLAARPWSRTAALKLASDSGQAVLDLSLGLPPDPPPDVALERPQAADLTSYPPTAGTTRFRDTARDYLNRRFGVTVPDGAVAPCVGAKEGVATLPALLRRNGRDTVLLPALGYAPYRAAAVFAGLRVERVPVDGRGCMDVGALPGGTAQRAVCLFLNSPSNPTGHLEPLATIAEWGRHHDVTVISDEAYAELTWTGPPRTVLESGLHGVLAVHSLSKRSHVPGLRAGLLAGDPVLLGRVVAQRRELGLIASGPAQRLAARLLDDDTHVTVQRERNRVRVLGLISALTEAGLAVPAPAGGLFAWVAAPGGSGRQWADHLATELGIVATPGEVYGPSGTSHVRLAAVADPDLIRDRLIPLASRRTAP